MKYFRTNNENEIVEIFPFNVFEKIPNEEFLRNCHQVDTDIDIKQHMYYINNEFLNENVPQEIQYTEMEQMQQQIDASNQAIAELTMLIATGGGVNV